MYSYIDICMYSCVCVCVCVGGWVYGAAVPATLQYFWKLCLNVMSDCKFAEGADISGIRMVSSQQT